MRALCGSVVICSTDRELLAGKENCYWCCLGKMFPSGNNNNNNNNNNKDIIIRDNEAGTCMLIDVAISGDRNVINL